MHDVTPYRVVYDATRFSFPAWPLAALGVAGAIAGGLLLRLAGRRPHAPIRVAGTVLVIFGGCWTLFAGAGLYAGHARLRTALRDGTYTPIEGIVYDRPPGGRGDPNGASWVVAGNDSSAHWYRYGQSPLTPGYRRAAPGEGGLHDGTRVRIADVRGRIAKVEVQ